VVYLELVVAAASLLGLALFAALVLRVRRVLERRRAARRFRRGARGQQRARAFLERRGFEILAEEHAASAEVEVDGRALPYEVRVDYVARRRGRLYGVEVKTGERAADPLHRPTRRQLLEYSRVFPFDGLYLLDMDAVHLMRIAFPRARGPGVGALVLALTLGFLLGAVTLLLLSR
jgi:hypothetical protein